VAPVETPAPGPGADFRRRATLATLLALLAIVLAGVASVVIQLDEVWSWVVGILLIVAVVVLAWQSGVWFLRAREAVALSRGPRPGRGHS
jgi:hypothetical protein